MKKLFLLIAILFSSMGMAQSSDVNAYQYVIVPKKYEFQKEHNQYRLNTLVKFLLEKEGFEVFFEGDQPAEVAKDICKALKADVVDESGIFTTKVIMVLKDCYGKTVFATGEGSSKIKEFEPSYHEALKRAFKDIEALEYAYVPQEDASETGVVAAATAEKVQVADAVKNDTAMAEATVSEPLNDNIAVLYAQPVENGYQLVDTTPSVVFRIRKTSRENTYTLVGKDGLFFLQEDGTWAAEYYVDGQLVTTSYRVKF